MVRVIYTEKKEEFAHEARSLMADLQGFLGIEGISGLRVVNRYFVENIDEATFEAAKWTVFAEPQTDRISGSLDNLPGTGEGEAFAVEYLPGQFDQRADSAEQCLQIINQGLRPTVRTAKIYVLRGTLSEADLEKVKKYVINGVEARLAVLDVPETLAAEYGLPTTVEVLEGFTELSGEALRRFIGEYGLAMDEDDAALCQTYFRGEGRQPTVTELRVLDTYWSDHCRHTTFLTTIDSVTFEDEVLQKSYEEYLKIREELGRTKPVNLMDLGTLAAKYLRRRGLLDKLDESEEINACTVKTEVTVDGKKEPWLLLFKNETHNHPTEIEPFGGAATCIGGAIRDPLSGRAYVYGAMRLTGAADPRKPVSQTLKGKLPQRKIVTTAAAGYSSYGNQIGLATGIVDEIYHEGYAAKRMEIGAVIGAAPAQNVVRKRPEPGDAVILLGGRTGRDGCGGATGSSKSHTVESLESCGAEVQKGNAPEERKLQRLFRNTLAAQMIKRCNDFGAGGVSVAIGELADGLDIDLDAVPKKYEGLDGTELAISESQERMAVVVAEADCEAFMELAAGENLEATVVARVKREPRLTLRWKGVNIVDLSREFLDSNGAEKHITVKTAKCLPYEKAAAEDFCGGLLNLAKDLNACSKRGLAERFDSTIGAGGVFMPFGGKKQRTPVQAMVQKVSLERGDTEDCTLMSWGFNPYISEKSPYHGAYLAVVESVCKLLACGASFEDVYLTFQEYFPRLGKVPERWGLPMAALIGAFRAQVELGVAAIGGKDSMSGSFEELDVPPTLVSFAVTADKVGNMVSPEFKVAGSEVILMLPRKGADGLPDGKSLKAVFAEVQKLLASGAAVSCYALGYGGAAEAVMKMCMGNGLGFDFDEGCSLEDIFSYGYGGFLLEMGGGAAAGGEASGGEAEDCGKVIGSDEFTAKTLGVVTAPAKDGCRLTRGGESIDMERLTAEYENTLEEIFPCNLPEQSQDGELQTYSFDERNYGFPSVKRAKPRVLIPVFPGTNCEYDSAKAVEGAGAEAELFVINTLSSEGISRSVENFAREISKSQVIFIPGGFSGGDEPDGSGKFITAFFRNGLVKEAVGELLERRDGLMLGICNGFQALIKLGLVPYGKITDADAAGPTLTYNLIGRHQSKIVRTRIASVNSPWLAGCRVGEVYSVPISHGEGRFVASENVLKELAEKGQIATQYVDLDGRVTGHIQFNPNGSVGAVEGILSPDGRVFGKMGHSERIGRGLYKNVPGEYDMGLFRAAVKYFR